MGHTVPDGSRMEHEEILQRLVYMLRRRAMRVRCRAALLQALFVWLCLCLALAAWHRFMPLPINQLVGLGSAAMVLCIIAAIVFAVRLHADPMRLLIHTDQTLKLRERLSTAFELATSPNSHPLRPLVLQEAARVARS